MNTRDVDGRGDVDADQLDEQHVDERRQQHREHLPERPAGDELAAPATAPEKPPCARLQSAISTCASVTTLERQMSRPM